VNGGLVSFESVLDDAFSYVPADVTIPGFLETGDLADIEAALAPRPMLLEGLIDGKDRLVSERDLKGELQPLYGAYHEAPANLSVPHEQQTSEIPEWLLAHL
jgi:hypothetical protein